MKKNLFASLSLLFAFILLSSTLVRAQVLEVTSETTPENMVEILIGSGLSYNNVVYTGGGMSRGNFWGGPGNIGVSNGIILTSGHVTVAPGPNNSGGAGFDSNQPGDPDLNTIAGVSTYDACVLEFDFVPEYNYVWFDYVFCSEEYHEYVNQFNDAFGFFISGPGISGPYSNNSNNIALIPLTSTPVSINTVNCGNPYNCAQSCTNCQFFVNNNQGFTQYDAFTTVLTAWAEVEPMQTYHIKLAIGDGIDHAFDSGVFLQASSFCSGPITGVVQNDQPGAADNYQVYPVPSGDVLNISSQYGQNFDIQLVGQDGRCVLSASGNSQLSIDISALPAGIYFLKITDSNGETSRKIFKK
jgi:hypothetical protein